ncbi:hypothetical protein WP8W18C01_13000 [Pseudomonas putida]|uniref:Phage tail assembly chaperone-like domain-containing protein n=1 Tax=Pseudomonas putida TaxID=303 RepID=A0A6S5TWT4_PSEPU|nr:hypothetical protein WP8W18C01_13000 [Pseudomonas putida]
MVFFDPLTKSFIPVAWKTDGTYTEDAWPADAVLLNEAEQAMYWRQSPPEGKQLGSVDGRPVWVDLPGLTFEQMAKAERAWRDAEAQRTEWLVNRHRDEQDMQLATTLTAEQFAELLVYRQALRDWPQSQAFPDTEQRPVAPAFLSALEGMQ